MPEVRAVDWSEVFLPSMSLAEIFVRGALTYLALCFLLRIIPKRQVGRASVNDMLFVVLVGGIAVEGISRVAHSLTDFFLLLATVFLVGYSVDWLAYRNRWFRRIVQEAPTCLIRDGRILRQNLRREMISTEELLAQLRLQGIDDPSRVKEAELEADGEISVVKREDGRSRSKSQ